MPSRILLEGCPNVVIFLCRAYLYYRGVEAKYSYICSFISIVCYYSIVWLHHFACKLLNYSIFSERVTKAHILNTRSTISFIYFSKNSKYTLRLKMFKAFYKCLHSQLVFTIELFQDFCFCGNKYFFFIITIVEMDK